MRGKRRRTAARILPDVNVDFGNLCRMIVAPVRSRLLLTGIELKVFNHLSEAKPVDAVGNLDSVVKRVYYALNPRGVFVYYFTGLTDEGTKPEVHVLSSLPLPLADLDTRYDQDFVAESMLRAEFRSVCSWTLSRLGDRLTLTSP